MWVTAGLFLSLLVLTLASVGVTSAAAACADTTIARAARTYSMPSSATVTYVEACTLSAVPGRRFLIEVLRPGGSNPLTSARVAYAGVEYLGSGDVSATDELISRVVVPQGASNLKVTLQGSAGARVVIRVTHVPEPLFQIYASGNLTGNSNNALSKTYTKYFTPADGVPATPHVMRITNGAADSTGASRATDAEVFLNSGGVVWSGELNAGVAALTRDIAIEPTNTVEVTIPPGNSGKKLSLVVYGTDDSPPILNVSAPADTLVTSASSIAASASVEDLQTGVRLFVDGVEKPLTSGTWSSTLQLPVNDGRSVMSFVGQNGACLTSTVQRVVVKDTKAPTLEISSPTNGQVLAGGLASLTISGQFYDSTATTVVVDGDTIGRYIPQGASPTAFSRVVPVDLGANSFLIRAIDSAGNTATQRLTVLVPSSLGALRDSTIASSGFAPVGIPSFRSQIGFIYNAASPLQFGADTSKISVGNESVIRGVVANRDFGPLANVRVSILSHPEYGSAISRADGEFDLAVTGGAAYVLRFYLPGHLEAQRSVWAPSLDYAVLDTVALIGRSKSGSYSDSSQARMVVGKLEGDLNSDRRIHALIPRGAVATITPDSGAAVTVAQYRVMTKEFTVGNDGQGAMPGRLPATTAYTYCVDLSLAEADSIADLMGPRHTSPQISFSKPVVTYLPEFLGLSVGTVIPSGYYDQSSARWVADEDGRVVKILSVVGGLVLLDTDGNGTADADSLYIAAGIDSVERSYMASCFRSGDVLWRNRVTHFSAHDFNLNTGQILGLGTPTGGDAGPSSPLNGDPTKTCGCIIENENRVLGESIPIKGTNFSLNYRSSRQFGDRAGRWIRIPLTGSTVPSGLTAVKLVVTIAGRQYKETYSGISTNDVRLFTAWDGTDAYGRRVAGSVPATVQLGFVFAQRYSAVTKGSRSFGNRASIGTAPSFTPTGNRSSGFIDWHTYKVSVGAPSMASAGLGGWTITPHHFLDTNGGGALYLGDGSTRYGAAQYPTIRKFAGTGQQASGFPDTTSLSTSHRTSINVSPGAMVFGPDGSLYFVGQSGSGTNPRRMVLRVKPNGVIHPWVGCATCNVSDPTNYFVDGDFALNPTKRLANPTALSVGPDGSLYVLDEGWRQVYRVTPDDSLHVVMGGYPLGLGSFREGAAAKTSALRAPTALAVGPEGDVYIGDSGMKRVIRIGADGLVHSFAGDSCCVVGTEGKADSLMLQSTIGGLAADMAGNVFISESPRLWQVTPDGRMRTITAPDHGIGHVSAGADGALYICTPSYDGVVRRASDGSLATIAGLYPDVEGGTLMRANFAAEEGGYAAAARMQGLTDALLGPDGRIYVSQMGPAPDNTGTGIRRIGTDEPMVKSGEVYYPSENGREVFIFTANGRHLRTVDVTSGVVKYAFAYDGGGRLVKITAADSSRTVIQRTAGGAPLAIVAPFGQRTKLALDGYQNLMTVRDSLANEEHSLTATNEGLLTAFTDPLGNQDVYTYGSQDGRLEADRNAALETQTFSEQRSGATQTITRTSPMARVTTFQITRMLDGLRRRLVNQPGGEWSYAVDSMNTATAPYGRVVKERSATGEVALTFPQRDKRYGVLAEVPATTYTTLPSGVRRTTTSSRDTLTGGVITETYSLNGSTFTNTYTASTRTSVTTTPEARTSTIVLDASNRPTSVSTGSTLPAVTVHYDATGRVDVIAQGGQGWRYGYDAFGRLVTMRDTLQRMVTYAYNNGDRVRAMTLPGGRTVGFGINANGGVDSLVTPAGRLHRFGYSAVDLNDSYTPPAVSGAAGNPTTFEYNADRQFVKATRPDGQLLIARYSSSGRLDSLMQTRGKTAFTYLPSGQIQSVTSPDGITLNYGYDGPVRRMESWTGLRGVGTVDSLSSRVNIAFQDSIETLNGGVPVTYLYDHDGLLSSVGVNGSTETITRRAGDGMLSGTSVGGVTSTLSYNSHGSLWKLQYAWPGSGSFEQVLDRDSLGRIVRIVESGMTAHTYDYHYDAAGRLDSVAVDGVKSAGYTYDLDGNRVAFRGVTSADTATATLDAQDRLLRYGNRAYSYTAAGELTSRIGGVTDTLRTTYDVLGNLLGAHVASGDTVSYQIDAANRRVTRRLNGVAPMSWMYTGGSLVAAELDSTGAVRNRYVYATTGHVPDLMLQGGTTYRMITDQLGSVRAVVNVTSGAVAQRMDFDAWGGLTTDTAPTFQSLGFAGGLTDRVTGLVRFGARDYEPGVGRWTCKDPSGLHGDINLFRYAFNAPTEFVDPTGMTAKRPHWFDPRHYGNWGGGGYRNGEYGSELGGYPSLPGQRGFQRPVTLMDECFREHDIALRACSCIEDDGERRRCRKQADDDLIYCLITMKDRGGMDLFSSLDASILATLFYIHHFNDNAEGRAPCACGGGAK